MAGGVVLTHNEALDAEDDGDAPQGHGSLPKLLLLLSIY
jgi:hypothetical protein